ncbi:MAG: flagellar export chaperone FliS [Rhodanobacteraceae bacterium]
MNKHLRHATAARLYQATDVTAAADDMPGRRVELAFSAILEALARARQAAAAGDPSVRGVQTSRALRLIGLLRASLDHAAAPELSGNLEALYGYCTRRLLDAALGDTAALPDVIGVIQKLQSGWTGAMSTLRAAA